MEREIPDVFNIFALGTGATRKAKTRTSGSLKFSIKIFWIIGARNFETRYF